MAVQGMGGIRKAETEVVRIKRRRRDKGGRVGEANQQGGRISPLFFPSMLLHALFSFLFWLKFVHNKNIYVY